jgi:hypothetical protein
VPRGPLTPDYFFSSIFFSPDGRQMIVNWWHEDRNVGVALIYRVRDLALVDRVELPGLAGAAGIDRTGRRLVLTKSHTRSAGFGHPIDAYSFDRVTRRLGLLSVNAAGERGNARSFPMAISHDGRSVLLVSYAWSLVPGDRRTFPPSDGADVLLATLPPVPTGPSGGSQPPPPPD